MYGDEAWIIQICYRLNRPMPDHQRHQIMHSTESNAECRDWSRSTTADKYMLQSVTITHAIPVRRVNKLGTKKTGRSGKGSSVATVGRASLRPLESMFHPAAL